MGRSKRKQNKNSANYSIMAAVKIEERARKKQEKNERRRVAKKQQIMEERHLVGFYGDYRQGTKEHSDVDKVGMNTVFKGIYATEPEYALYQIKNADESALVEGNNSILIEVYEISKDTLDTLDIVHGYEPTYKGAENYYVRKEIKSPFGKIFIYFWNDEIKDADVFIRDGDWVDFIKNIKTKEIKKKVDNYLTNAYGTAIIEIEDQEKVDKEFMD